MMGSIFASSGRGWCRLIAVFAVAIGVGFADLTTAQAQQPPIKFGFGMSLTGPLAGNGKAALISMQIWAEDVNAAGGILGRKVELVFYDDQGNASTIPGIYSKLLDVDKVDMIVSGFGTNFVAPAMPIAMQRKMTFMTLFGVDVNSKFKYDRYFAIVPAGPEPAIGWTKGFFDAAETLQPAAKTVAIVGADAEYPAVVLDGARAHAKRLGLKVVYDKTYPPNTVDYSPILRAIQATNPELIYVASYPPDTAGMVRAANEIGLKARMFGGGMVGLQFAALRTQLGPLLNGIVNFEVYAPEARDHFPFLDKFLEKYQERAVKEGVDPLGYFVPPYAYAMMQVLEKSIREIGVLDQEKLADHIHKSEFETFVGKVRFGKNGEWAKPRMLAVQYGGIVGNDLDQWRKAGRMSVLSPFDFITGGVKEPFQDARK